MSKSDMKTLHRGLKLMVVAVITAAAFVFSVWGFIKVATCTGYLAVLIFLASVVGLGLGFILLYAQGIVITKNVEGNQ